MTRSLVWIDELPSKGWGCSKCAWKFPVPTLLSDPEAKSAYDRLASARFREHVCEVELPPAVNVADTSKEPTFTERVRKLLKVGYKPKDAVEIALQEIGLEHRNDPKVMLKARAEGDDFLRRVREGLI